MAWLQIESFQGTYLQVSCRMNGMLLGLQVSDPVNLTLIYIAGEEIAFPRFSFQSAFDLLQRCTNCSHGLMSRSVDWSAELQATVDELNSELFDLLGRGEAPCLHVQLVAYPSVRKPWNDKRNFKHVAIQVTPKGLNKLISRELNIALLATLHVHLKFCLELGVLLLDCDQESCKIFHILWSRPLLALNPLVANQNKKRYVLRGPILDLADRLENNHHWGNGRVLEQWVHDQPWRVLLALAIQQWHFFIQAEAPLALKITVCGSGRKLPCPFEFKVPAVWPSTCYHVHAM